MKRQMNVYSAFGPIFHVSRTLGVLPLATAERKKGGMTYKTSRLAQVYSFSLISMVVGVVIYSWKSTSQLFYELVRDGEDSRKRLLVNKVEYTFSVISSLGNLVFSMTCGKRLTRIFQTVSKVDATLRFPIVVSRDMRARQRSVRRLATVQSISILAMWVLAVSVDFLSYGKGDPRYWRMAPFYFLRLITFCVEQQFVQVALIFRERFVVINDTLEGTCPSSCFPWNVSPASAGGKGGWRPFQKEIQRGRCSRVWPLEGYDALKTVGERREGGWVGAVERLRVAHDALSSEMRMVSKAYELPLLTDILMMFFDFIAGGYFFVTDLLDEGSATSWGSAFSWVTNSSLRIAFLSWVAWNTSGKAKMAGPLIVRLMRRNLEAELKEELNIFLMQLSQQQFRFNILGLFYLDMTLLQALTQAATSYLLVLVQFQASQ